MEPENSHRQQDAYEQTANYRVRLAYQGEMLTSNFPVQGICRLDSEFQGHTYQTE
jgi:hypothetical protein